MFVRLKVSFVIVVDETRRRREDFCRIVEVSLLQKFLKTTRFLTLVSRLEVVWITSRRTNVFFEYVKGKVYFNRIYLHIKDSLNGPEGGKRVLFR